MTTAVAAAWSDDYSLSAYNAMQQTIIRAEAQQAEALGGWLNETYHPKSVVDIGCGPGIYLLPFKRVGALVCGVDGAPAAGTALSRFEFLRIDLRRFFADHPLLVDQEILPPQFDLALCLELAEHLPAWCAEHLVRDLCCQARIVCFSAAAPGQGGTGHINEQPREYWRQLFARRGYHAAEREDILLRYLDRSAGIFDWLKNNLMLLECDETQALV